MKILVLYHSEHHGNTEKIAKAMAEKTGSSILIAENAGQEDFSKYDIIGFGSGVYNGRLHGELSEILSRLPQKVGKKAFIFSTTGSEAYSSMAHDRFRPELEEKGFKIIGEFSCLGFDTALTEEGINKGRPNEQDIQDAENFILNIISSSNKG